MGQLRRDAPPAELRRPNPNIIYVKDVTNIGYGTASGGNPSLKATDLIYVDGSHTAWAVMVDLSFCAAMLKIGGVMVLDDYWHHESEIGGPGVKQAVDRFHGAFRKYFEIEAVYRQVALRKVAELPR